MSPVGGQPVISWPHTPPHHITIDMRMTDSPDSACEADNGIPSPNGNTIKVQSALQEVQVRPASPFVPPPPPPPPPPANGFHTQNTVWTQLVDSDGDSGIMRLGSTSSSETDHSSSGFPDNYLSKLQVKHFTWIPPKPTTPLSLFITPVRGDHSISALIPVHSNHQSNRPKSVIYSHHQAHQTISHSHPPSKPRPLSWHRQKSMSVADVRRIPNCNIPATAKPTPNRPLSLVGYPVDTCDQTRKPIRCSCHTACVHCGAKFAARNFLRSTSDIPSRLCESPKPDQTSFLNIYDKLARKDEVFNCYDMIKVHARPASVIPEPISHRGVTPRQAKSADAASRQRRLQKAYSMTSALDSEELVKAHASIASVIPTPVGQGTVKYTNTSQTHQVQDSLATDHRAVPPSIPPKPRNNDGVLPELKPKAAAVCSNYKAINKSPLRKEELQVLDVCPPPPPSASQAAVTYAKVNKLCKPVRSCKGKHGSEVSATDDNEPPLPPRNYRSEKGQSHNSFAGKMQGFTRSAKEAFRKAFGLDCNAEDQVVARNGRRSQRNGKPATAHVPRQKTKDQETAKTSDYVEI